MTTRKSLRPWTLAPILVALSAPAWAGGTSAVADALGNLGGMFAPLFQEAASLSTKLVPYGEEFLAFVMLVEIARLVFAYLVRGGIQESMSQAVTLVMVASVPLFMLANWDTLMFGDIWPFFHTQIAGQFIQGLAPHQIVEQCTQNLVTAENSVHVPYLGSAWDMVLAGVTNFVIDVVFFLANIPLITMLVFALFGPRLLFYMGAIFGPILVCWLPFRPLSKLFWSWLMFMLTAAFAYTVGVVLVTVVAAGLANIGSQFSAIATTSNGQALAIMAMMGYILPVVGILLFMMLMLSKVESIAAALIGGTRFGGNGAMGFAITGMVISAVKRHGGGGEKGGGDSKSGGGDKGGSSGGGGGGGKSSTNNAKPPQPASGGSKKG